MPCKPVKSPREIDAVADTLLGIKYAPGGRDPRVALDCWGVVLEFYRRAYAIELPDPISVESATCEAAPVASLFRPVPVEEAMPGDVAQFEPREDSPSGHLGILLRRRRVLHPIDGLGVVVWPIRGKLIRSYRQWIEAAE